MTSASRACSWLATAKYTVDKILNMNALLLPYPAFHPSNPLLMPMNFLFSHLLLPSSNNNPYFDNAGCTLRQYFPKNIDPCVAGLPEMFEPIVPPPMATNGYSYIRWRFAHYYLTPSGGAKMGSTGFYVTHPLLQSVRYYSKNASLCRQAFN